MGGGFHLYYEAARALWDMPTKQLESLAREGLTGQRRAATTALRLKAEFVTPEGYDINEGSAVTKLAAELADDREFTMDMALRMGGSVAKTRSRVLVQSGVAHRSGRSTMMWIAITAAVVLLLMDVMATAGLPVPTPIGELIDRFSGSDESPITPGPPPAPIQGLPRDPAPDTGSTAAAALAIRPPTSPEGVRIPEVPHDTVGSLDPTNAKEQQQGQGRYLHQAQGREQHQAQGRELHQGRGRDPGQAEKGDGARPRSPPHAGGPKTKHPNDKGRRSRPGRAKRSHE